MNKTFTVGATIGSEVLPLSAVLLDTTLVSFGKQTLYTPTGEVLHMHIHCSSRWIAGEENWCTNALRLAMQLAIGGAA